MSQVWARGVRKRGIEIEIPIIALSPHGGTRVLVEFANFAAAAGHSVRISLPRGRIGKSYEIHPMVEVSEFSFRTGLKVLDYAIFLAVLPFILRGKVVVANFFVTYFPVAFAQLVFRRRFVYFVQDIESKYKSICGRILNILCEITYRSQRIVTANAYLGRMIRLRGGLPLSEVNLGVSEGFLNLPNETPMKDIDLVVFPRHEPWKGLDRLVRVLKLYREQHGELTVLCLGQNSASLDVLGRMGFTCERPTDENALIRGFDRASVLLFTSYHEGFGLPPLEGMARALPAVVFESGGPSAYMQDGVNGFLIPPDDEQRAVECIHRLLSDSDLYRRVSMQARATAERHSMKAAVRALLAVVLRQ